MEWMGDEIEDQSDHGKHGPCQDTRNTDVFEVMNGVDER